MVTPISKSKLLALHANCCKSTLAHPTGIAYGLGDKANPLSIDSALISSLDCSGYVRYGAYKASGAVFAMPDGSATQHEWCSKVGLPLVSYHDAGTVESTNLYLCFLTPQKQPDGIGHVWFLMWDPEQGEGQTYECHGGCGVDTRNWDAPIQGGSLADCDACFVFPSVA